MCNNLGMEFNSECSSYNTPNKHPPICAASTAHKIVHVTCSVFYVCSYMYNNTVEGLARAMAICKNQPCIRISTTGVTCK